MGAANPLAAMAQTGRGPATLTPARMSTASGPLMLDSRAAASMSDAFFTAGSVSGPVVGVNPMLLRLKKDGGGGGAGAKLKRAGGVAAAYLAAAKAATAQGTPTAPAVPAVPAGQAGPAVLAVGAPQVRGSPKSAWSGVEPTASTIPAPAGTHGRTKSGRRDSLSTGGAVADTATSFFIP